MINIKTQSICLTHIGERLNHEDNFLFASAILNEEQQKSLAQTKVFGLKTSSSDKVQLYAISDGMGGHNAGEVASRMVVNSLEQFNSEIKNTASIDDAVRVLQNAIARINDDVKNAGLRSSNCKGMGATLVVFLIHGTDFAVLNVGDSRAYMFDGETTVQITKDNTEGQRLLDLGLLNKEEVLKFPARKHLSRCMGYGQKGFVLTADVYKPHLNKGVIMLCSDGISDNLTDEEISQVLKNEKDLGKAGQMILEKSVAYPKADNATLILISIGW